MQSWSSAQVPALPGRGPELRLYDTSDRQVRPVAPGADRHDVRLRHHALRRHPPRPRRHLPGVRSDQPPVAGRSATTCTTCRTSPTSTTRCSSAPSATASTGVTSPSARSQLFRDDMAALRVLPPRDYVGRHRGHRRGGRAGREDAGLRRRLRRRRRRVPRRLLPRRRHAAVRLRVRLRPRHHADTVRRARRRPGPRRARPTSSMRCCGGPQRPGEPSWPSPFGPGRPGWHVECAAIALSRIGTGLDIQGGGSDLIFPHHEFSAAHAESVTRRAAFRASLRARRHDRLGRAQDVQEPRQPGAGVADCAPTASTRRPSGWDCWPGHYRGDRFWSAQVLDEAQRPAAPLARRDGAAGRARRRRCDRPGAPLPGRRPRYPESACRT